MKAKHAKVSAVADRRLISRISSVVRGRELASHTFRKQHHIVLYEFDQGVIALAEWGSLGHDQPILSSLRRGDPLRRFRLATGRKSLPPKVDAALRRRDESQRRMDQLSKEHREDRQFVNMLTKLDGTTSTPAIDAALTQARQKQKVNLAGPPVAIADQDWDWEADAEWFRQYFCRGFRQTWCATNVTWASAHRSAPYVEMTGCNAAFESDATIWAEHWTCSLIFDCWYRREVTLSVSPRTWCQFVWD